MAFLDDLLGAIETYPDTKVQLVIQSVVIPGAVINVGDIFTFRVAVTNTGLLNMVGVGLWITGSSYVSLLSGSMLAELQIIGSETRDVPSGHTVLFGPFRAIGKAETPGGAAANLVAARLYQWDANLDYLLRNRSVSGTVKSTYAERVVPV